MLLIDVARIAAQLSRSNRSKIIIEVARDAVALQAAARGARRARDQQRTIPVALVTAVETIAGRYGADVEWRDGEGMFVGLAFAGASTPFFVV